ncbi:hypothetical protein GOV05_01970 [Candidatus Woesearchaeota archaeon]|nr:hypothetical protein [Candidatus Woesearchaeota archaeon]
MDKKEFYVGVENTKEFRRNLLEASKGSVNILKSFQRIRFIRKQKIAKFEGLKKEVEEINGLVSHLDDCFPELGLRADKRGANALEAKKKITSKKRKTDLPTFIDDTPMLGDLHVLDKQLDELDKKLEEIKGE